MYYQSKYHWGPHIWSYIHIITIIDLDYYNNIKISKEVFEVLKNIKLPCTHCQKELDNELTNNIDSNKFGESMYLFKWSWEFHNRINTKLRKPTITYQKALELYSIAV